MLFSVLLIIVAVMLLARVAINIYIRHKNIASIKQAMYTFVENYELTKEILGENLDADGIYQKIDVEDESDEKDIILYESNSNVEYVFFMDFGLRLNGKDFMEFTNTKELRKCFLIAGNVIMKVEDYINNSYDYRIDNTDEYQTFYAALVKVRQECLRNGETTLIE